MDELKMENEWEEGMMGGREEKMDRWKVGWINE